MRLRTPRLARRLVSLAAPREDRAWLLADLDEEAAAVARRQGPAAARRWYRRQALGSLAPLARRRLGDPGRRRHSPIPNRQRGLMLDTLKIEVRQAVRAAGRAPVSSLVVVATLALGIGATATIATVLEAVLLRPLPFPASERIVRIDAVFAREGPVPAVNYLDLQDVAREAASFAVVAPVDTTSMTWLGEAGPNEIVAAEVGEGYHRVLGVEMAVGRPFAASEQVPGADAVVVLGHGFWLRAFGADPAVIGRGITLDGRSREIVGVLPPMAVDYPPADVWVPLAVPADSFLNARGPVALMGLGRVRGDRSVAQASSEVATLADRLARAYPKTHHDRGLRVITLHELVAGPVRPMLLLLAASVGAVLLIASTSIAGLLGARARRRQREFAVRAALGGGWRLGVQVVAESAVLAVAGGLGGLLLAPPVLRALLALYPQGLPRAAEVFVGGWTVATALAATAAAALLASLPLAWRARRLDLAQALQAGGRSSADRRERRVGAALVVAQVAMTVSLLWIGGLFLRAFWDLSQTDPGYEVSHVLTFRVAPVGPRYETPERIVAFYDDLISAVGRLSGVRYAGAMRYLPLVRGVWGDGFRRVGLDDPSAPPQPVEVNFITPALPQALGLPVVAGRSFADTDRAGAPLVALLNETAARHAYPSASPLGRRIEFLGETREIVGILADKRHGGPREAPAPEVYLPVGQSPRPPLWIVVRTSGSAAALASAVGGELRRIDPTLPISRLATLADRLDQVMAPDRFRASLAGVLGVLALFLAALGLYGLVSSVVSGRTREFGIRLALGERASALKRRVVARALALAGVGTALGGAGAAALTPWVRAFLPDGEVAGPAVLAAIGMLMALVTLAAAWGPARRASRVDPLTALRCE